MKVFSTKPYTELASDVAIKLGADMGKVENYTFADGESYHKINNLDDIKGQDIVLVGGTTSDSEIMNMYNLASSLATFQIRSLHVVIPYFGYSTMERAVKEGEVVKAKNIARMFSHIPQATRGNFVYLIDIHTPGLQHYFEGETHVFHLYAKNEIKTMIKDIVGDTPLDKFVLASTDAGRAKWVESLANEYKMQAAFVLKRRDREDTEITAINANVQGKNVIIYDDMIRSGGSLINAANAYKEAGADKVYACATHGIFCSDGLSKLKSSGVIEHVYVTNTHSNCSQNLDFGFTSTVSVADLIAKGLSI